jgi:serine/threonine protein kinase
MRTPDNKERELLGSIYTMAPEQFEEDPIDARTDLYALGCVLYFVLTGSYPFDGDSVQAVVNAHLTHTLLPLEEARPDLPAKISSWVMQLMKRNSAERPDSADSALDALRAATAG